LGAIGLCGYDLMLTKSRGGLLAGGVGALALFHSRYGFRRTMFLAALTLPLAPLIAGGRQLDFAAALEESTGQSRIQLWAEGLGLFRQAPLFGIGQNEYAEQAGLVAHNSYIHCFTELGFFGGAIFLAAFLLSLRCLHGMAGMQHRIDDDAIRRLRPYLLATIGAYAASMLSLSRPYVAPTYLVLGMAAVWLRFARVERLLPDACFDARMVKRMGGAGVAFIAAAYLFVRVFAHWGA
jgi:hypothetical protein